MALLTYEQPRAWVRSIKEKVTWREMPPWFIVETNGIQKFTDDPSLNDARSPRSSPGRMRSAARQPGGDTAAACVRSR
jgi:hypothetical protein